MKNKYSYIPVSTGKYPMNSIDFLQVMLTASTKARKTFLIMREHWNQQNQEKEKEIVYIERERIVYVVKEESELSKTVDSTIKGTASFTVNLYYIILLTLTAIILITISFGLLNFLFIDDIDSPIWSWYIKYFTNKEFFQVI